MASLLNSVVKATPPFTVFIEGNIGAGKTTFLNHLKRNTDVCLFTEPVNKWRNVRGLNLLNLLYNEGERWAFPFQSYAALTMLQIHTAYSPKRNKIMERSLYSARYCFTEAMLMNHSLHSGMYDIMQEWFNYIEQNVHIQADLIVYLKTTPEILHERMKIRARSEEATVPLSYLKQLHDLHEQWLVLESKYVPAPVFELNADLGVDAIQKEYARLENIIVKYSLKEGE